MPITYRSIRACRRLHEFTAPQSEEIKQMEENNMATLRDEAQAYEPPQTLNVADLDNFPVDIEVKKDQGKNREGEEFTYFYIEIGEKRYRVPGSVLGGIKAILKKMPHIKEVSVIKEGHGMNTRYNVVPYTPPQNIPPDTPSMGNGKPSQPSA